MKTRKEKYYWIIFTASMTALLIILGACGLLDN